MTAGAPETKKVGEKRKREPDGDEEMAEPVTTKGGDEGAKKMESEENSEETVVITKPAQTGPAKQDFNKEMLRVYYRRLFPYEQMFKWLSYSVDDGEIDPTQEHDTKYWKKREICFTLEGGIFCRYKSFHSIKEFKTAMCKALPFKIDIGPVYNIEPKNRSTSHVDPIAEEKELVFDIDISDYDDVRHCCKEARVCDRCWPLMLCAMRVLDHILYDKFNFINKLWVFSGRRGIHCWVADPQALKYTHAVRTAIIRCIETYTGNSNSSVKVDLNTKKRGGITQFHRELFPMCNETFEKMLETQDLFMQRKPSEDGKDQGGPYFMDLLEMIREPELREKVQTALGKVPPDDSTKFWALVKECFAKESAKYKKKPPKQENKWEGEVMRSSKIPMLIESNLMEIVFAYTFPRVDVEVTKGVNHLLKAPFCIHPKTGKICTPIRPSTAHEFGPSVATLGTLHEELDSDAGKTSLTEMTKIFEEEFLGPLQRRLQAMKKKTRWRETLHMVNGVVEIDEDYSKVPTLPGRVSA